MLSFQRQNQSTINKLLMFKLNFNQNRKQKSISFITNGCVFRLHLSTCLLLSLVVFVPFGRNFCTQHKIHFRVRPSSFVKLLRLFDSWWNASVWKENVIIFNYNFVQYFHIYSIFFLFHFLFVSFFFLSLLLSQSLHFMQQSSNSFYRKNCKPCEHEHNHLSMCSTCSHCSDTLTLRMRQTALACTFFHSFDVACVRLHYHQQRCHIESKYNLSSFLHVSHYRCQHCTPSTHTKLHTWWRLLYLY